MTRNKRIVWSKSRLIRSRSVLNVTPVVFPLGGGQRGGEQEFAGGGKGERAAEQQAGGDSGAGTSGPPSPPLQVSHRKTSFKETVLD
jgi:hypothetical protein